VVGRAGEAARAELGTLMPGMARQCFAGALLAAAALALPLLLASRRSGVAASALVVVVAGTALAGNRDLSRGYRVEPELVFAAPPVARQILAQRPARARYVADDPTGCPSGPIKDRADRTRVWTRLDTAGLVAGKGAEFGLEGLVPYLPLTAAGRAGAAYEQLPDHVLLRAFGVRHRVERVSAPGGSRTASAWPRCPASASASGWCRRSRWRLPRRPSSGRGRRGSIPCCRRWWRRGISAQAPREAGGPGPPRRGKRAGRGRLVQHAVRALRRRPLRAGVDRDAGRERGAHLRGGPGRAGRRAARGAAPG
jgi:hypothetical protein